MAGARELDHLLGHLDRIRLDFQRVPALMLSEAAESAAGAGLATGPWGLSLAVMEAARFRRSKRQTEAAASLVEASSRVQGMGLFAGPDGQRCSEAGVQWCLKGMREAPLDTSPPAAMKGDPGDLMDGLLSVLWARSCQGARPLMQLSDPGAAHWQGKNPGIAHGRLGLWACQPEAAIPDELERLIALDTPTAGAGWCNGLAGGAVAALIGYDAGASDSLKQAAREYARSAMGHLPLATDGLCHGTMGVLVIGAGVARCTGDQVLLAEVRKQGERLLAGMATRAWRLNPELVSDPSWLYGAAGIVWGALVISARPVVNPLLPPDSLLALRKAAR